MPTNFIKCILVDDELLARSIIENYVAALSDWKLSASCSSASEAYNAIKHYSPDVLFLDIHMPGMNGLDLIPLLKGGPLIILITACPNKALDAFELEVFDYLVKPVEPARFLKTTNRIAEHLKKISIHNAGEVKKIALPERNFIFIRCDGKMIRIMFSTIRYFVSQVDYVRIHLDSTSYLISLTLKEIEEEFPSHIFIRVHRSYIVNINKIVSVMGNSIDMGSIEIPIGLIYKDALYAELIK